MKKTGGQTGKIAPRKIVILERKIAPLFGILMASVLVILLVSGCASVPSSVSAEDSYSLGVFYFEKKNYSEATRWFSYARNDAKTQAAAVYYLGRIAFEQGRYEEASRFFKELLERDSENTMVLRALAFSYLKGGRYQEAIQTYQKIISLLPAHRESLYNYALLLYTTGSYEAARQAMIALSEIGDPFSFSRNEILLRARIERALQHPEALEFYQNYLATSEDPQVLFEFASCLTEHQFYGRAADIYNRIIKEKIYEKIDKPLGMVYLLQGKNLLLADAASQEGALAVQRALQAGIPLTTIQEILGPLIRLPLVQKALRENL
ncbi:MAG: tetratricopeptide repeat protein [Treponemataceae bacterium]|nr:tetratricopeptide repeat protein [Treponemataceae bacterium]